MAKAFALLLLFAGAAAFVLVSVMPYPIEIDWTAPEPQLSDAATAPITASRAEPAVTSESRQAFVPPSPVRTVPAEVVTLAQRAVEPVARMPMPASSRPVPLPGDRVTIARELQRELRRVGCYDGEINGVWTPATRRASKAFTDRINAALPNDEPDLILLRLAQDQQDKVCGAACPAGQAFASDGRCVPTAVLGARKAPFAARAGAPSAPAAGPVIIGRSSTRTIEAPTPSQPTFAARPLVPGGPQLKKGPAPTNDQPPPAGPGLLGLAPASAVSPGPSPRPAAPTQPAPARIIGFGPGVFRQVEKTGF
jgi:hypothetical protein